MHENERMRKISDERLSRQAQDEEPVKALSPATRAALAVAKDYPIFPVCLTPKPNGKTNKKPWVEDWEHAASQDAAIVARWWRKYPDAYVGVPMGARSGLVAIDIDPRGRQWFEAHRKELGSYRLHPTVRGKHLVYQYPADARIRNTESKVADGVDVRGAGGFLLWWPAHGFEPMGQLGALPSWLRKTLVQRPVRKLTNGHAHDAAPEDWAKEHKRVVQALAQLDPDCSHDDWRDIAAALSWATGGTQDGEDIFVAFSEGKYNGQHPTKFPGELEVRKKYRSFKNEKDNNVTLATLYQMVKDQDGKVPAGRLEKKGSGKDTAKRLLKEVATLNFDSFAGIAKKAVKAKRPIVGEWLTPGAWLMVGRPKMGKSWLLLQMMLCLARGRKFLDFDSKFNGHEMLALCAEDDDARIKTRVRKLGGIIDPAQTHVINREMFLELAKKYSEHITFEDFLRSWIKAHPRMRLVVIDTEASARLIWGTRALPEKGYQSITEVDYKQTAQYDQLAIETGCAIVLTNHTGKMTGKRNQVFDVHEMVNRSNMALAGASGSWVLLEMPGTDPNDSNVRQRRMSMRGRDLEEDIDLVVSRAQGHPAFVSEGEYVAVAQSQVEVEILKELLEQMDGRATDEYVTTAELASGLGKGREGIKRAVTRMSDAGRVKWNGYRITVRPGRGMRLDKLAGKVNNDNGL